MMDTLPRELRAITYGSLHDPYIADPSPCVGPDEDANSDTERSLNEATNEAKSTTPLDLRFSFLKCHYF